MSEIANQIEWIRRLVSFDTTSAKSNLELIRCVDEFIRSHGVETHLVPNSEGTKANLYALVGPKVEGGIVLSGHTDVVPVEGQQWDSSPWELVEKEGLLYGRGTCDMKGFIAICVSLLPDMLEANLSRPIILALSYDEEVGCLGAPDMIAEIKEKLPSPSAVIIGEPTMLEPVVGHKGIASFRVMVKGFTTHSSQTDKGVSAVELAAKLVSKITDMREQREASADPHCPFHPPYTSLTANVIKGGTQLNIMADACEFDFDMRVLPNETSEDVFAEFQDYASSVERIAKKQAASCSITTTQMSNVPAFSPSQDSYSLSLVKSLTSYTSSNVVSYATEAGQFQLQGFSTVVCGPGSIDQAHKANEFISLEQVEKGTEFIRQLINKLS